MQSNKCLSKKIMFCKFIAMLSIISLPNDVWATTCTHGNTASVIVNAGTITVQRDAPLGLPISDFITGTSNFLATCNSNADRSYGGMNIQSVTPVAPTPNYQGNAVFSTGLQGVGSTIGTVAHIVWSTGSTFDRNYYIPTGSTRYDIGNGGGSTYFTFTVTAANQFRLIKTANAISSGIINIKIADMIAMIDHNGSIQSSFAAIPVYLNATINVLACSVSTPNVNVMLPTVNSNSFTGVGHTQGDTPFTVGLQCDAGAKINATLNFIQDNDTTNQSVAAVTGKGNTGVASGVGIQLLYGSTPLNNNTLTLLKTSGGGIELPAGAFTARYFQTKNSVQPGSANTTATMTLTYQ
ncbi:hypothetical protein ABLG29_005821 [Klebsiella variicola]